MVRIEVVTLIAAPIERCFDLSRSIDLHVVSTDWSGERAIAGTTSGLIGMDQEVTWRGRHFGIQLRHTSRITRFVPPRYFQDSMVQGAFASFCHDHSFETVDGKTAMTDRIELQAPLGFLGLLVEPLLGRHIRSLIIRRNACIKRTAEGEAWRQFLDSDPI